MNVLTQLQLTPAQVRAAMTRIGARYAVAPVRVHERGRPRPPGCETEEAYAQYKREYKRNWTRAHRAALRQGRTS